MFYKVLKYEAMYVLSPGTKTGPTGLHRNTQESAKQHVTAFPESQRPTQLHDSTLDYTSPLRHNYANGEHTETRE